jgi:hypothetical protein
MPEPSDTNVRVAVIGGVFALAAAVITGLFTCFGDRPVSKDLSYEMRILVLSPDGRPSEDATIRASHGGAPRRVPGGWQIDIPRVQQQALVKVFASKDASFLSGSAQYQLGNDLQPVVTVRLVKNHPAGIRGVVVDESGRGVPAATVGIVGVRDVVTSDPTGQFSLHTDAADGQQVLLRVEKPSYVAVTQWHSRTLGFGGKTAVAIAGRCRPKFTRWQNVGKPPFVATK